MEPLHMLCTSVYFSSVAERVFSAELAAEAGEPAVVREGGAHPLAAWVVLVGWLVATEARGFCERSCGADSVRRRHGVQHPVAGLAHLAGLVHHCEVVGVAGGGGGAPGGGGRVFFQI